MNTAQRQQLEANLAAAGLTVILTADWQAITGELARLRRLERTIRIFAKADMAARELLASIDTETVPK